MDKLVVKELIQNEMTTTNLVFELHDLLLNESRELQIQQDYTELKNLLSRW